MGQRNTVLGYILLCFYACITRNRSKRNNFDINSQHLEDFCLMKFIIYHSLFSLATYWISIRRRNRSHFCRRTKTIYASKSSRPWVPKWDGRETGWQRSDPRVGEQTSELTIRMEQSWVWSDWHEDGWPCDGYAMAFANSGFFIFRINEKKEQKKIKKHEFFCGWGDKIEIKKRIP